MRDEFLDPQPVSETEVADDAGLRPRRLAEFVGQGELKEHLGIVLQRRCDRFPGGSLPDARRVV